MCSNATPGNFEIGKFGILKLPKMDFNFNSMKYFFCVLFCSTVVTLYGQNIASIVEVKGKELNAEQFRTITTDGGWCWFSDPRAVYYEGKHKRTYTGWVTSAGDIVVAYYDHQTQEIKNKMLYEKLEADDHDNPTILIGKDGKLKIFFSKHARSFPIQLFVSAQPENIDEWEKPISLALNDTVAYKGLSNTYTYQNVVYLQNEKKYFIFWRGADFKPNYSTSNDGIHWSSGKIFVLPDRVYRDRRPYMKVSSDGKSRIDFAFTDGHPRDEKNNSIYYMYYVKGTFYKANGSKIKNIGEPVRPNEADIVYDAYNSANPKGWIWDLARDKNGNPVLVYAKFPDSANHLYCVAKWDGKKWINHELVNSGKYFPRGPVGVREREPNYSGGICIDHEDPSILYLSVERNGIFEIERWTSKENGKWEVEPITKNSKKDNIRPFAVRNAKSGNPVQVIWVTNDRYVHYTDFHSSIKMNIPEVRVSIGRK